MKSPDSVPARAGIPASWRIETLRGRTLYVWPELMPAPCSKIRLPVAAAVVFRLVPQIFRPPRANANRPGPLKKQLSAAVVTHRKVFNIRRFYMHTSAYVRVCRFCPIFRKLQAAGALQTLATVRFALRNCRTLGTGKRFPNVRPQWRASHCLIWEIPGPGTEKQRLPKNI